MQGYWIMYHYWSNLNQDIIYLQSHLHPPPNRETLYSPEPQPLDSPPLSNSFNVSYVSESHFFVCRSYVM